jgi:hypothetical protein
MERLDHETVWSFVTVRVRAKRRRRRILPAEYCEPREEQGGVTFHVLATPEQPFPVIDTGELAGHAAPTASAIMREDQPRDIQGRPVSGNRVRNLTDL